MNKRGMILISILALALSSGCGVNKDEHAAKLAELSGCHASMDVKTGELNVCEGNLKNCQQAAQDAQAAIQSLGDEKATLGEEKEALAASNTALKDLLDRIKKANEKRQKAMDELLSKFSTLIASGKLSIGVNDGRMVIQLPSNVLFPVGRSKLSKDGKQAVVEVAEVLNTIDSRKFQVAGHTDNQRGRSRVNPNWTLSYMRARSVFDLMVKSEMDESRLSIAAYAEYSPVAANDTKESMEKNRRIEIVLLPTSDELPLKQLMKIEKVKKLEAKGE